MHRHWEQVEEEGGGGSSWRRVKRMSRRDSMSESGAEAAGGRDERMPLTPARDGTGGGTGAAAGEGEGEGEAGRNHRRFGFQPKSKGGGTPGRRRHNQGLRRAQQAWSQRGEGEEEEEDQENQQRRLAGQALTPSLIPRQGGGMPRRPDAPRGVGGPAAGPSLGTSADVSGDDESAGFWASAREGERSNARGPPPPPPLAPRGGGGAGALATKEAVFLAGAGQRSPPARGIRAVAEGGRGGGVGVHAIDRVTSSSEGEGLERHELRVALVRIKRLERGWEERSSAFEVRSRAGGERAVRRRCVARDVACGMATKRSLLRWGTRFCYSYIVPFLFFGTVFFLPLRCGREKGGLEVNRGDTIDACYVR